MNRFGGRHPEFISGLVGIGFGRDYEKIQYDTGMGLNIGCIG